MKPRHALILGAGAAGLSCARLLLLRGWQVDLVAPAAAITGPVVVLNPAALELLRSMWGLDAAQLRGAHPLARRLVAWEAGVPPASLDQPALALPLDALTQELDARLDGAGLRRLRQDEPAGERRLVDARGRLGMADARRAGSRVALSTRVRLATHAPEDRCTLESVSGGWLFLVPLGGGAGMLQAVVPGCPDGEAATRLQDLCGGSRLVAPLIDAADPRVRMQPAMPACSADAARPQRIAIGDAALALDPVSGGGLASGLRGAALAAAVLDDAAAGGDLQEGLQHYALRLAYAAHRHLAQCLDLYRSVPATAAWQHDIDAMAELAAQLQPGLRALRHGLRDGRLRRLAA
jgi:2-polyprenyl-6-methoxyphenol hydroxylase-like FAD-dependent oxidoreductase